MRNLEKSNYNLLTVARWIKVPQELIESRNLKQHYLHCISVGCIADVQYMNKDKKDHWTWMYQVNLYDTWESHLYSYGKWMYRTSKFYDKDWNDVTV